MASVSEAKAEAKGETEDGCLEQWPRAMAEGKTIAEGLGRGRC